MSTRHLWIIALIIAQTHSICSAQTAEQRFIFDSNLPDEVSDLFRQENITKNYSVRMDLNPFYLRDDFDNDGVQDYAIGIIAKSTGKKGILIYHVGKKKSYVVGAGKSLPNGNASDDYDWMDAWKIHTVRNVEMGVGETRKLVLKGEAILAMKTEAASGLIYWTGTEYRWYQQGD